MPSIDPNREHFPVEGRRQATRASTAWHYKKRKQPGYQGREKPQQQQQQQQKAKASNNLCVKHAKSPHMPIIKGQSVVSQKNAPICDRSVQDRKYAQSTESKPKFAKASPVSRNHASQPETQNQPHVCQIPFLSLDIFYSETAPKHVSMMIPVIWYGSALDAGRRSSK